MAFFLVYWFAGSGLGGLVCVEFVCLRFDGLGYFWFLFMWLVMYMLCRQRLVP